MASARAWPPPAAVRSWPAAVPMAARNSPPKVQVLRIARLTKRADFLAAARHLRRVHGVVTLEMAPTPAIAREDASWRLSCAASTKIGNAVGRSAAKRRLRAAGEELFRLSGCPGH